MAMKHVCVCGLLKLEWQSTIVTVSHIFDVTVGSLEVSSGRVCICVKKCEQEYLRPRSVGGLICFHKAVLT